MRICRTPTLDPARLGANKARSLEFFIPLEPGLIPPLDLPLKLGFELSTLLEPGLIPTPSLPPEPGLDAPFPPDAGLPLEPDLPADQGLDTLPKLDSALFPADAGRTLPNILFPRPICADVASLWPSALQGRLREIQGMVGGTKLVQFKWEGLGREG
ncbi:hypothetical protein B0J17DRAFT_720978 [Rhizoctonia solani]|nr:hypothetical protein B0J17DRAFT_720978 [Rhizoctonia solani]